MVFNRKVYIWLILLTGGWLRFSGLNWDGGYHLQPDERYISLVLTTLKPPASWREYIDPNLSTLSPYINGYGAYIYGQLPVTALTYLSRWLGMYGYDKAYLLGRMVSAFLDTLSIMLVYKLGKRLWSEKTGVIGAGFYAFSPLAIQYSHFMTMESWTTFSWLIVILILIRLFQESPGVARRLLTRRRLVTIVTVGVLLGAAMAVKASSVALVPLVVAATVLSFKDSPYRPPSFAIRLLRELFVHGSWRTDRRAGTVGTILIILAAAVLSFRFFQPTIFASASWLNWSLRQDFYQAFNLQRLAIEGKAMFPPQWQWVGTARWWFPLKNIWWWGLGPTVGILAMIGLIRQIWRIRQINLKWLMAVWAVGIFLWQGGQFVKTMRYFLPFFPVYALFAASVVNGLKRPGLAVARPGLIIISAIWAVMFTNIYRAPTTRVMASEWIYQNIPSGSKIMLEEWDDPLPLLIPGYESIKYQTEMVEVYAPDDEKKKTEINRWVENFDWMVLSSPRAKGSIGKLPKEFPQMSKFYRDLDSGSLGFAKAAEFTSFPGLKIVPQSGIPLRGKNWELKIDDSSVEESFWVYDHPRVEIYRKVKS